MANESIVGARAIGFAVSVIKICRYLFDSQKEYVLSRQLLRSGTAIGALIREAVYAESKADFIHKMSIALKEANETDYWLLLLIKGSYMSGEELSVLRKECDELIKMLASIVKTAKENNRRKTRNL